MSRRSAWIGASIVALVAVSVVSAAGAANSPTPSGGSLQDFTPAITPLGVSSRPTTVVVELAGDPVTVTDANSATPLTKDQKNALRDQLRSKQSPVESQIESKGGHVLASYQSAYNGVKVLIPANKAASLASIPGVVAVHPLQLSHLDNVHGVPLIGAPAVWDGLNGFHGEHIKIADIDTGLDYTHADFGGPGTPLAYQTALASDATAPDPSLVGPLAPKVKGGIDLVGDSYNADPSSASYQPVPHPDPNPLDCNGHGTHTAGTAAGFGVLSNGATYTGPYNSSTISGHSWNVGPGVAPKADLYAVRIFGCAGSTNETIDAIEWAVNNDMDVINMSLGSPFGSPDSPDAVASTNAAKSGVIVVASSGNSGPRPYITGTPASSSGTISVAASDPSQTFPGVNINLTPGGPLSAINANGYTPLPAGPLNVRVIWGNAAHTTINLGCSVAADTADGPIAPNTVIVVARGTCARVAKAIFGQQAGAAAVIMVNTDGGYPPFEGKITSNPDDGTPYDVTIPFLGVKGGSNPAASAAGAQLIGANGGSATLTAADIPNPGYLGIASFSSWGPASHDSSLKPNVTAPGVSIASAGMGTGNEAAILSGTSMAAPHTTGLAALVKQAHPTWKKVKYWSTAIENTADPAGVAGFAIRGAGSGLIQAVGATQTQVVALGGKDNGTLNFGFNELSSDFNDTGHVKLKNFGDSAATFNVTTTNVGGSPHSLSLPSSVIVPARGDLDLSVGLNVPAASAGDSSAFNEVSGLVTFTPASGSNNGVTLRVPYYMVPQALSNISTKVDTKTLNKTGTGSATVTNSGGVIAGTADWYAWGLADKKDHGLGSDDLRAVGVQSFPFSATEQLVVFAISTQHRWSNAAENEFDILVDVNGDGTDDYDVLGVDHGALTTGTFDGVMTSGVVDLRTGQVTNVFSADAPFNSSTALLVVRTAQLCRPGSPCLNAANPRFAYHIVSFGLTDDTSDSIDAAAKYNAWSSAISQGMFDTVAPNGSATETVTTNATEWALTPPLGLMIVSHDNKSGTAEAQTVDVKLK